MLFFRSFFSELLKIKRSSVFWLCVVGALVLPVVFTLRNIMAGFHINLSLKADVWMVQYAKIAQPFTAFIMPMGMILLGSLITQIEYRNNNWKQVHCTPQKYATIFFAKYAVLLMLMVFTFLLLNIAIYLFIITPTLILDGQMPTAPMPLGSFATESVKCFIVGLPIIGLQYLISLRFRSFLIPIGVGFALFVFSLLTMGSNISVASPYSYSFYYVNGQMPDLGHVYYFICILLFIGLSVINYLLYSLKKDKS